MHICTATTTDRSRLDLPPIDTNTSTFGTDDEKHQEEHHRQTALLRELTSEREHAPKSTDPLSHSSTTSMFNRKHDDPSSFLNHEDDETRRDTMRLQFKSPSVWRWLTNIRLQWRIFFYILVGLIVLLVLYAAMNRESATSSRLDEFREGGGGRISAVVQEEKSGVIARPMIKIKIDVYMESQCPDTADFLDSQLVPTWAALKDNIQLKVIPFGKARWTRQGDDDYSFQCQHGRNECLVNQLQCCGNDKLKTTDAYLPYLVCLQMTSFGDEDEAKCAQRAGISAQEMQTCADGKKGRQLHYQMGNQTKSLQPPLYFVPWVIVDGKRESAAVMDLKAVVCRKLTQLGVKPTTCQARLDDATTQPTSI